MRTFGASPTIGGRPVRRGKGDIRRSGEPPGISIASEYWRDTFFPRETFIPTHTERVHPVRKMHLSPGIAKLTATQLKKVRTLEDQLGVVLVAHEKSPQLSDLTRDQIRSLQEVEKGMGMVLVAYRKE